MNPIVRLLAVGGACAVVAGCSSSSSSDTAASGSSSGGGVIHAKVALIDDMTGSLAVIGIEQRRIAELAIKDVNSSNSGVQLSAVTKDSQSSPSGGVTAVQSALSDSDVAGVIGYNETEIGQAAMPLLGKDGRPAIFLQVTALPNRPPNVFSMGPPTNAVAKLAAEVVSKRGVRSVGIIWVQQPTLVAAAQTFKDVMNSSGIKVAAYEGAALQSTSFDSQVVKTLAKSPGAVGVSGVTNQDGTILASLRSHGYHGLVFAQQAADSPITRKIAGDAYPGLIVGTYWDKAAANTSAKRMLSAYKSTYPSATPPDVYGLQAWDAVHAFADAVKAAGGTDKAKLMQQLKTGSFPGGLQDRVSFGSDGFAKLTGYVVQMTANGSKVLLGPGH